MNQPADSTVYETHPSEDWELTVAMPDEREAAVWLKRGAESANVTRVW